MNKLLRPFFLRMNGVRAGMCGAALVLSGCALPPSHYSGDDEDRAVQPSQIRAYRLSLDTGEVLGRVTSVCEAKPLPDGEFSAEKLNELDCNKSRLIGVLQERASDVGGTALAELLCVDIPPEYGPETDLCTALVVRSEDELPEVQLNEPEAAQQAWHVAMSFVPNDAYRRGAARTTDNVDRLDITRQSEVVMGTLSASCEDCAESVVRDALRVVAAKLGVVAIVGSVCRTDDETTTCVADVSGYEKDPGRIAAAR